MEEEAPMNSHRVVKSSTGGIHLALVQVELYLCLVFMKPYSEIARC